MTENSECNNTEWLVIESAPKNETVLVAGPYFDEPIMARWEKRSHDWQWCPVSNEQWVYDERGEYVELPSSPVGWVPIPKLPEDL